MYQISANLVHRELSNATFEGEKMPTSIKRPDSGQEVWRLLRNDSSTRSTSQRKLMSAPVLVDEKVLLDPERNADGPEQVVGEALGRRSVV